MDRFTLRNAERRPTHPGALLRDVVLPALQNVTKVEVAQALNVSRQTLYDVLKEEQPVTPQMAVRLAAVFGSTAGTWLRMQNARDLWTASHEVDLTKLQSLKSKETRETV